MHAIMYDNIYEDELIPQVRRIKLKIQIFFEGL